jgi:hypothetical protein
MSVPAHPIADIGCWAFMSTLAGVALIPKFA